jgi:hypothetical protein
VTPTEQKRRTEQKKRTRKDCVDGPVESSPEGDEVEQTQSREEKSPNPFPAPRHRQNKEQDARWDEVQQQGKGGVPESVVFLKYIQRKKADEPGKEKAKNSGRPEQETFHGRFHNGIAMVASSFMI